MKRKERALVRRQQEQKREIFKNYPQNQKEIWHDHNKGQLGKLQVAYTGHPEGRERQNYLAFQR